MTKITFLIEEKEESCKLFENGVILCEIGKIFRCSETPIKRILIKILELKKYKEIAKEHLRESVQENIKMAWNLPRTEAQIQASQESGRKNIEKWNTEHPEEHRENGRKMGIKYGPENGRKVGIKYGPKNAQKMNKWKAEHHNWISKVEDRFYDEYLKPIFYDQDLRRQYYLKGINHAFDFALPDFKVLIEVDGDYTHSRPGRPERDAEINEFLWRTYPDWTLYRYTDADMRKLGIV